VKGEIKNTPAVQVIIAALNEEEGIGLTITEIMDVLKSPLVLVVDGRSSDRTVEVARNLGARVLVQDGFGKGQAHLRSMLAKSQIR
jgi:dolichol-phosphate hexosyltransferase